MANKVAIVTGSGRGIGRAVALALSSDGYDIVVNSRNSKEVSEVVSKIKQQTNSDAIPVLADIRYHKDVTKLVKTTVENFKRIDVLVNNAGVAIDKTLVKTSDEEWDLIMDTNLKGVFYCCKEVLPYMMSQKSGKIINISSGAGKHGFAELSAYCASKFGLIGLSESLAMEVGRYGIGVIAICPGAVATSMQQEFMSTKEFERRKSSMIQPEDVAKKVLQAVHGKFRSGSAIDVF